MGIETTNFNKGRMNKSIDERLLPPGEYIDAMNVRVGATETTEIGAVENSRGNEQMTTITWNGKTFSSAATTIGSFDDGINETLYWFVHDPKNDAVGGNKLDAIISYNTQTTGVTLHVVSSSVLNFNPTYLITGVNLIDDMLFFTDDLNPPRKINVNRNYPDPLTSAPYADVITEDDISVILKPPGFNPLDTLTAPLVKLINVPGEENYLENRFISFAYRYRYLDNEYSATSLFTNPAFQPAAFQFDTNNYNNVGMQNFYNSSQVSFNTGPKQVKEVDVLFKDSNTNNIFIVEKFNKKDYGWADNSTQVFTFTNSKVYSVIGQDELLRLYDNVPRTAKAQTIQGNRLMYGNYVDQYNISNDTGSQIAINYQTSLFSNTIDFQALSNADLSNGIAYTLSGTSINVTNSLATFDFSEIADKLKLDATIGINLRLTTDQINGDTADPCYNPEFSNGDISVSLSYRLPQDFASVYDMVSSPSFANAVGTVVNVNFQTIANCANGSSVTDEFNCNLSVPTNCAGWAKFNSSITDATAQQGFRLITTPGSSNVGFQPIAMNYRNTNDPAVTTDLFEYFRVEVATANFTSTDDISSLHSNRDYETGIVYMDEYARASTVLVSEYNTTFVPSQSSINQNKIQVDLINLPPFWATKYKFVLKPSKGGYETIFSNFFYVRPSNNVIYFKLEGDNQNKVTKGQELIVKRDVDGPVEQLTKCTILDVTAEPENFLASLNELGEDTFQLPGLYMQIKAQNFNITIPADAVIEEGDKRYSSDSESICRAKLSYPAFTTTEVSGAADVYNVYNIPAGSIIYINARYGRQDRCCGCDGKRYIFEKQFVSSSDYDTLYDWFVGDNIDPNTGEVTEGNIGNSTFNSTIVTSEDNLTCVRNSPTWQFWQAGYTGTIDITEPLYLGIRTGIFGCRHTFPAKDSDSQIDLEIIVTRANNLIVFESEPADANSELFYDASETYDIKGGFHQAGLDSTTDISQTATTNAFLTLNFMDCYTFGNGVESYKIKDSIAGRSVVLGQRVLAATNANYEEADRFADITYSGVYSNTTGVNNLNEFNLGLANYKECETVFGPIQLMHPRKTDILVLQEDRITYVLAGKNVITDSTGGGVIASVPQVLGTQIARIEEYGISFNPESFATYGYDMFFTDTKRLAVIKLRGTTQSNDTLEIISQQGMRSFFRDTFIEQLATQKIGGFDPYMMEYVLHTNDIPVPFPIAPIPCGTTLEFNNITTVKQFVFDFGNIIDSTTTVTLTVTGSVTVTGVWNGVSGTPVTITNTTASYTFDKNLNTPTNATITITPTGSASYTCVADCPTETDLKVVQVVLNSSLDAGDFIHVEYGWKTSTHISPIASTQVEFLGNSTIASLFDTQVGIRSLGVFPYDGVDFVFGTNKIGSDDFDVNASPYKLSFLSSATTYNNTTNSTTGIPALVAAASGNVIPSNLITNPGSDIYIATVTPSTTPAFSLPIGNQYLYLIYDFRVTTAQQLCYDAASAVNGCCDCTVTCTSFSGGSNQVNSFDACQQPLSFTYYFLNTQVATITPVVGSLVFTSSTCDSTTTLPVGFYRYQNGFLEVNNQGIVIQAGSCA